MLNNRKKITGPSRLPPMARLAPSAAVIGRSVPQNTGSPTPQSGPIRPILMLLIVPSDTSAPFARASSIAAVTPRTGPAHAGVTLKKFRWRLSAAACSALS